MKCRGWLLMTAVTIFGMLGDLSVARSEWNGNVGSFCATYRLPGGCLSTAGARCHRLDCYIERRGKYSREARQEREPLLCDVYPQCEYKGPGIPGGLSLKPNTPPFAPPRRCDPNYKGKGVCVPIASDVDCTGGCGNGPAFVTGPFRYTGTDVYGLDADHNGIACEHPCED